jgi:hypothetical protein
MLLLKLNPIEPPWYGPVCPVVWEGRRREVSPYPDQSATKGFDDPRGQRQETCDKRGPNPDRVGLLRGFR